MADKPSVRLVKANGSSLMEYAVPMVVFFGAAALIFYLTDVPGKLADFMAGTVNGRVENGKLMIKPMAEDVETAGGSGTAPADGQ